MGGEASLEHGCATAHPASWLPSPISQMFASFWCKMASQAHFAPPSMGKEIFCTPYFRNLPTLVDEYSEWISACSRKICKVEPPHNALFHKTAASTESTACHNRRGNCPAPTPAPAE